MHFRVQNGLNIAMDTVLVGSIRWRREKTISLAPTHRYWVPLASGEIVRWISQQVDQCRVNPGHRNIVRRPSRGSCALIELRFLA